ncbi:hypothetical protein JCM5350_005604 [Sporobolomyces pararoseus]
MNFGQSNESRRNGTGTSGTNGKKSSKKAGKGRGREMLVKIYYSLQSPRFGSASTPTAPTPTATAPSPDFLSVLDPSLASSSMNATSPNPYQPVEPSNPATNYSCIAKLSQPVMVQIIGGSKKSEERVQFGRITLKTLLSAVCISRPELIMDPGKDFAISAVDPYETWKSRRQLPSSQAAATSGAGAHEGGPTVVEGKGMLSWAMQEKKEGLTTVCGKITGSPDWDSRRSKRRKGDDGSAVGGNEQEDEESDSGDESEETLEVWLQLNERNTFSQNEFLTTLRSYDNPIDLTSSPQISNRRDPATFPSSSTGSTIRSKSSSSTAAGDPVKRPRSNQDRQSLPLSASTTALPLAPPSAFANLPVSQQPLSSIAAPPALSSNVQAPELLALFAQLVSSATASSTTPSAPAAAATVNLTQNQQAIQHLARLCGLPVPENALSPPAPSTQAPTSTSGPVPRPSIRPPKTTAAPTASALMSEFSSNPPRKKLEHFTPIDVAETKGHGKHNPRDPLGCSNCKRKKSTIWRAGLDEAGNEISVCNACGTFYNKNGYHRAKTGQDQPAPTSSRQQPSDASNSASTNKPGRPLTGRLTATCEADLNRRKVRKRSSNGSPDSTSSSRIFGSGIIPPLSPSKHVGPRSPSLSFGFGGSSSRGGGNRAPGIMSSPGRSPRLRHRQTGTNQGAAATSPLRAPADAFANDGGFDFAALFGGHASPSPKRRSLSGNHSGGGGGVPNYLLTASPGTALNRILNDTNIGSLSSLGEPMQVDGATTSTVDDSNPFNFFLQPGSPSQREQKENERPRASTVAPSSATATIEAPLTDADSFESALSSLRRDFNTRLSSNALTAPSSPVPSSPCVQPRTSTATPGSKGKAPLSSGRAPPSIFDSFTDGLVTGICLDSKDEGATGRTPHTDSDTWSPPEGRDDDKTLTFDSLMQGGNQEHQLGEGGGANKSRPEDQYNFDLSHLLVPGKMNGNSTNKRPVFIPSHLVPASDATEFDLGSLPPSSPPQLPSETFPTPSDFDGVTPGTEGGDQEERGVQERLTIEDVAQRVATEPNEDARAMVMQLLKSAGSGKEAGAAVELPGISGGDSITLDRSTVDRLLSLITAKPPNSSSSTTPPTHPRESSSSENDSRSVAPKVESNSQESPDLSQIDFFNHFGTSSHSQSEIHHSEQMNGLYSDLFANTQF